MPPTPESAIPLPLDGLFSQNKFSILPAGKALDFVWDHRGHVAGALLTAGIGLASSFGTAAAFEGNPNQHLQENVSDGVEMAVGAATIAGIMAAIGNGIRTYHHEKNLIDEREETRDKMILLINSYGKKTGEELQAENLDKMIKELRKAEAVIFKKKAAMWRSVPFETFQALFGVSGAVGVAYYTLNGALEDMGSTANPWLKAGLSVVIAGGIYLIYTAGENILALEGPSGSIGGRVQGAISTLEKRGLTEKEEKKVRPKLEVGMAPNQSGDNGKQKKKFKVKA